MPKKDAAKKPSSKPTSLKLKAADAAKVKGGRPARGESCKETGDSGVMGCPG